jgi:hypothetical protein
MWHSGLELLTLRLTLVAYACVQLALSVGREEIKRHLEYSLCRNSYLGELGEVESMDL